MCPNSARQNRDTARRFHWRLWHIKSPDLSNAVSQSPRPPVQKKETAYGGPGVLWHIKIRFFPNAPSQSFRIQLALNSETACRVPKRKPANYPRILLCRILELLCLCREKRSVLGKTWLQRRQKQSCRPSEASGDILRRWQKYYR